MKIRRSSVMSAWTPLFRPPAVPTEHGSRSTLPTNPQEQNQFNSLRGRATVLADKYPLSNPLANAGMAHPESNGAPHASRPPAGRLAELRGGRAEVVDLASPHDGLVSVSLSRRSPAGLDEGFARNE